jgi:hypothetical protein
MILNSELRRNLWLEITQTRLIVMPMVLLSALFMAWLSDDHRFGNAVQSTAMALFVAITYLWGMRQASESVVGEIRERTWDWQRMSAITPWSLTWGKYVGSTIFIWYGGLICLPFLALSWQSASWMHTIEALGTLVLGALLTQGIGFLISLQMLIRDRALSRSESSGLVVLAFFLIAPFGSLLERKGTVVWYGSSFASLDFALLSLGTFLFWILAGAYCLVRTEFKMRTLPVAWVGFVLFLMVYVPGFDNEGYSSRLSIAGMIAVGLTYLMALLDKKDPVTLQRLLDRLRQANRRKAIESLPAWGIALIFAVMTGFLLALSPGKLAASAGGVGSRALIVAVIAFLLRDLGILLYLNLAKKPQRADMFMLICLAVLYGLAPGILRAMGAKAGAALFWPHAEYWGASLMASILGAVVAWQQVVKRWKGLAVAASGRIEGS